MARRGRSRAREDEALTVRSLVGLTLLNGFVLGTGAGLMWGLRGWRSWAEFARLAGLAYMLGVAGLGILLTFELVVGMPFSLATVVLTALVIGGAGVLAGLLLGRPRPHMRGDRGQGLGLVAAAFAALVIVYLEALFRSGRLSALTAWDAWAFWVPKATMIYVFGGLEEDVLQHFVNPTYPPIVPALEAAAFEFMGSADVVTLHVQFWFFLTGFVAALVGLLATRVPPLLLWPFALLVLVAPRVVGRTLEPQADFLLDYFFALAALLVALWLIESQPWQLASAAVFLGAAMLTKREGQLLAACVVAAGLAASWPRWRRAWPRLALAAAVAVALAVPWRIWFTTHDLTGEFPGGGDLEALVRNSERAWPSLQSVLTAAFDYDLWLVVLPLAGFAIALAFLAGARVVPAFASLLYVLALAGFTWALWSFTEFEVPFTQDEGVNFVVRLMASLVLLSAALVPLLLDAAWRGTDSREQAERA